MGSRIAFLLRLFQYHLPENQQVKKRLEKSLQSVIQSAHPIYSNQGDVVTTKQTSTENNTLLRNHLIIYQTAKILQHNEGCKWAVIGATGLLNSTLQQKNIPNLSLADGTAGLTYLFKKLWVLTQKKQFLQASTHWCNQTIHLIQQNAVHHSSFLLQEGLSLGLSKGIIGTALVLHSLDKIHPCNWDECLLLS